MLKRTLPLLTKFNPKLLGQIGSSTSATGPGTSIGSSTSTSADEINHFQQLAPTWWDTNGSQRILHKMNLSRMDFIQRILSEQMEVTNPDVYVPGFNYKDHLPAGISAQIQGELETEVRSLLRQQRLHVLDVGCGGGILSESLGRQPYVEKVYGIDLTPDCIAAARAHRDKDPALQGKIQYDLLPLEEVEGQFDVVTMFEMLEHVENPSAVLDHAWRRLKPEGILFVSTINRNLVSWFTTICVAEHVLRIVPKGTHHLEKYLDATEVQDWFQQHTPGAHRILDLKGNMYVPMWGWVEHDLSSIGNYCMAVKKLR
ncbi:AaceriADR115Wp [[Ashbya] aceris (nom. inval.)]|nr:AaceriADR115Wp [[Ashbya] aceris (nom. inval.)]